MRRAFAAALCRPSCRSALTLETPVPSEDVVVEGTLRCGCAGWRAIARKPSSRAP
jgi:hypothetical protein